MTAETKETVESEAPGQRPEFIPVPRTIEETRIRRRLLEDLALKILHLSGELSLRDLSDRMRIGLRIVEDLFGRLRKENLLQVTGMAGGVHRIVTTSEGRDRAIDILSASQYAGAVPVSLNDWVSRVRAQTVRHLSIDPQVTRKAFDHLVLGRDTLTQIGTALASGRAIFLYGPPGTGKTTIADSMSRLFAHSQVWVPYAVEADGQIIEIYDPGVHHAVEQPDAHTHDARWIRCERPRVTVGGELTIEMLDLQQNPTSKYYTAPVQMKASNGLLIIDDFGRQRVRPDELLNRWVVPLDRGIDFLTLTGGRKLEIPFDMLVVFATNLDPSTLVDEAFLRRIQTKIRLDSVTRGEFHAISRRVCAGLGLEYQVAAIDRLLDTITNDLKQELRACYPRDIIQQVCWTARYQQRQPTLDDESIDLACRSYFVSR
jgi:energy-coupling factor transporter ATP-binding protein EcfA2